MDPAEEIVSLWLQQKGFFIMHGVKAGYGGKEIDFLGVDIKNDKKIHVEVHASVFPVGPLRPWSPARYGKMPINQRVRLYYTNKFIGPIKKETVQLINRCIEQTATRILGSKNYERRLVLGVLHQDDPENQLRNEFNKFNVKVFLLKEILKDIQIKGTAKDQIGRFIQLLAAQFTDEAKANLLRRK